MTATTNINAGNLQDLPAGFKQQEFVIDYEGALPDGKGNFHQVNKKKWRLVVVEPTIGQLLDKQAQVNLNDLSGATAQLFGLLTSLVYDASTGERVIGEVDVSKLPASLFKSLVEVFAPGLEFLTGLLDEAPKSKDDKSNASGKAGDVDFIALSPRP